MEEKMAKKESSSTVNIDGKDYNLDKMSEDAKAQLASIKFVDIMLQQLQNEWAVSDTARLGYTKALQNEKING